MALERWPCLVSTLSPPTPGFGRQKLGGVESLTTVFVKGNRSSRSGGLEQKVTDFRQTTPWYKSGVRRSERERARETDRAGWFHCQSSAAETQPESACGSQACLTLGSCLQHPVLNRRILLLLPPPALAGVRGKQRSLVASPRQERVHGGMWFWETWCQDVESKKSRRSDRTDGGPD